jgi:hypothetical protein
LARAEMPLPRAAPRERVESYRLDSLGAGRP